MADLLRPGGRFVVADLMFENAEERARVLAEYRGGGQAELARDIEEEFFWDLEVEARALARRGLTMESTRFSTLSWGFAAVAAGSRG